MFHLCHMFVLVTGCLLSGSEKWKVEWRIVRWPWELNVRQPKKTCGNRSAEDSGNMIISLTTHELHSHNTTWNKCFQGTVKSVEPGWDFLTCCVVTDVAHRYLLLESSSPLCCTELWSRSHCHCPSSNFTVLVDSQAAVSSEKVKKLLKPHC